VPATLGEEERGRSKSREAESNVIAEYLPRLMMSERGRQMTFGIITFYSRQVKLIHQALVSSGITEADENGGFRIADEWRWLTRPGGETEPRLEIGTVDAFQGREFDVVFLSVVRSNKRPDNTQKERQSRYGHLMSLNRMCVAMSRQKVLLIAVGDVSLLQAPNAKEAIGPLTRFYELCEGDAGVVV
jgi:superfamily I DNA and/or RNA helicase